MAGLNHDFLLLDCEIDGDWSTSRFAHDPRAIHLHDDLLRYMTDTLVWIPTYNPARREQHMGLCMWGVTAITADGASIAEQVFLAWANLFSLAPPQLRLTGSYGGTLKSALSSADCERVSILEGGYAQLVFDRDQVVETLQALARYAGEVLRAKGRLYLLHEGI